MPDYPYQVTFTQGDPKVLTQNGSPSDPAGQLVYAPLPELFLGPGFYITVGSYDEFGTPVTGDVISDVALTLEDSDGGWED